MFSLNGERVLCEGRPHLQHAEAIRFIRGVATRKERNNGLVRHLERTLEETGSCAYKRKWQLEGGVSRLAISVAARGLTACAVACEGLCADIAVARANGYAVAFPGRRKAHSKKTSASTTIARIPAPPRRQYRHRALTWRQAVGLTAYAFKMAEADVSAQLSLRHGFGPNPRYRLYRGGITIEIEILSGDEVGIFCTKENRHRAYRRLRAKLKQLFHIVPKEKQERRKRAQFIRLQKRLAAA